MNIKNGILNVPKHGNNHDLIHFVTLLKLFEYFDKIMHNIAIDVS